MRDLTCHYCETVMVVEDDGLDAGVYMRCPNLECNAAGPDRPTSELAAAAHATVAPALRWSKKHVPPPRWQRCAKNMSPQVVRVGKPDLHCKDCEFCPIPLPLEPGKGGGA